MKTKKSLLISSAILATVIISSGPLSSKVDHTKADTPAAHSKVGQAKADAPAVHNTTKGLMLKGDITSTVDPSIVDYSWALNNEDGEKVLSIWPVNQSEWLNTYVNEKGGFAQALNIPLSYKNSIDKIEFTPSSDGKKINLDGSMRGYFNGYLNLKTVDFRGAQNGVDSNSGIHYITDLSSAFSSTSISEVLNTGDISFDKVTDVSAMFSNSRISDVSFLGTLPSVTNMSTMFANLKLNGATLDVSKFDTSNVTDMSGMFLGVDMPTLNLSNFNTSKVTNMARMFKSAASSSLDLSNFNTSNVTNTTEMFSGASKLSSLDVSKFDTSNVTNMSYMFSGASKLSSLDVSKFDTSNVTNMTNMFSNASNLSSLDLSNFNTSNVTNMTNMFSNASNLSSLDISKFDTSNVTNTTEMFSGASKLSSLDVSKFDTSNVTDMSAMFQGTNNVTKLDLSNFNTSKVTNMKNMFYKTVGLSSLDLHSFDTSKVTDMTSMFQGAVKLKNLNLGSFTITSDTNDTDMFSDDPIHQLSLGATSRLSSKANLNSPVSNSQYSGKWQTLGTGSTDQPNGSWAGTTDQLISRSATGAVDTYAWQPAAHDYVFAASDVTVNASQVSQLDIIQSSKASVKDNNFPEAKFTVQVKDNGGLKAKAGTYTVTLGVKEVPSLTKTIRVKVTDDATKPDATYQTMYRVYNKNTGEHFYTASTFERDNLVKTGWTNEGTGWKAPTTGAAIYRVYNPNVKGGDHYYTASNYEAQSLVKTGWKWDNGGKPVFYSGGQTKIYVAYNPNAKSGSHNYTSSQFEQNTLLGQGWKYGKVQFYGK